MYLKVLFFLSLIINFTSHSFNHWSHSVMIFVCGKGNKNSLIGAAAPPEKIAAVVVPGRGRITWWSAGFLTWWQTRRVRISCNTRLLRISEMQLVRHTPIRKTPLLSLRLKHFNQGNPILTCYFNMLSPYWQQIGMLEDVKWSCSNSRNCTNIFRKKI